MEPLGAVLDGDSLHHYSRRLGEQLRRVRQQVGLSLEEVDAQSDREFKASVLGAYERGHRVMSMPRLQRLARFYGVAVDRLLPADGDDVVVELNVARAEAQYSPKAAGPEPEHVIIDVRSLSSL